MHYFRKWIRNTFGFSRNEINGFLILLPLMVVLIFSEPLYHCWLTARRPYKGNSSELDSLAALWHTDAPAAEKPSNGFVVSRFNFDPNLVTVEELRRLGFSEILAKRIAAYRRKGGVFRVKSDLMKIYDVDSTLYKQLYQYIMLPSGRLARTAPEKAHHKPGPEVPVEKSGIDYFDVNTADTTVLKRIDGIGPVLASRIVKFRDGLGGFVTPTQLFEVYGLDSAVVRRLMEVCFVSEEFTPRKININTADEATLSRHPYIRYTTARMLVNYRFQHGDFMKVSDIKKLSALKPENVGRLLPYLTVIDE